MLGLLEFLTNFYWLSIPETVIGSIWRHKSVSPKTLAGLNDWPFFVSLNAGWSGAQIEEMLSNHGIEMWGWDVANGEMFFRVAKSDAAQAQSILLSRGVPLLHRLYGKRSGKQRTRPAKRRGSFIGPLFGGGL